MYLGHVVSSLLSGAKHLGLCFLIAVILFSPQARDTFSELLALISKYNQNNMFEI